MINAVEVTYRWLRSRYRRSYCLAVGAYKHRACVPCPEACSTYLATSSLTPYLVLKGMRASGVDISDTHKTVRVGQQRDKADIALWLPCPSTPGSIRLNPSTIRFQTHTQMKNFISVLYRWWKDVVAAGMVPSIVFATPGSGILATSPCRTRQHAKMTHRYRW